MHNIIRYKLLCILRICVFFMHLPFFSVLFSARSHTRVRISLRTRRYDWNWYSNEVKKLCVACRKRAVGALFYRHFVVENEKIRDLAHLYWNGKTHVRQRRAARDALAHTKENS